MIKDPAVVRWETFMEMQTGKNPLTIPEIWKLIKKDPIRYGFMEAYLPPRNPRFFTAKEMATPNPNF